MKSRVRLPKINKIESIVIEISPDIKKQMERNAAISQHLLNQGYNQTRELELLLVTKKLDIYSSNKEKNIL